MAKKRKSGGETPCLRILHLSDFHFRLDRKWDQDPVLNGLADSIEQFVDDGLEPDVVVFTGDIAFSGKKKEYDEASKWIDEKLLPALPTGFDDSRLLFVPGNHDVDRDEVKKIARLLQADLLSQGSQDAIAQTLTDPDERSSLLKRHAAYLKFAKRFGPTDKPSNVPWWSTTLPVGDKTIHFSGLCSSWMSCGDEDQGRLLIGRWQLNKLLKKVPAGDLSVVLVHHPWLYLPDFDRGAIDRQVHREAHVVLRGHLHEQLGRKSTDLDYACVELAAGSVYDGSDYSNAFQLVEIIPDKMLARVHYRTWHNGEWIVDRNAYKNAPEGVAEFSLQASSDDPNDASLLPKTKQPAVPDAYRKWLQEQCADIEFLGLKVKQGQAVRLNHIYVPLTTTPPPRDSLLEGTEAAELSQKEEPKPTLLLDQLNESSLYVPGAPGAGKSTFCRWVAFLVACRSMPPLEVGSPEGYEEAFPTALRDRFPLLVRLRDFWDCLPMKPGCREMAAADLEEALSRWIDKKKLVGISGSDLVSHLEHGSALLILDGVDEVPLSHGDEKSLSSPREMLMSGLMDALPQWHDRGNRVLLTSRPYGLNEDSRCRLDFRTSSINPLTTELQALLVRRWFHTLMDNAATAQSTAEDMIKHIGERVGMDELANNPMLLTAMCIIYGEGKRLPQDTYDLYGRIIDNVLYNRFPQDPVVIEKVRNRLAVVAYGMHTGDALNEKRTTPQAVASYDEIDCMLREFQEESPETEPGMQHTVETREQLLSETGFLLPQGEKRAGFYHLSLQEFLAAQRILNFGNAAEQLFEVFRERAVVAEWRKTLSFLFACLVAKFTAQHGILLLTQLVNDIPPESLSEDAIKKAVVAADCVEVLLGRDIGMQDSLRESLRKICMAADKGKTSTGALWTLGVCLGRIGDPKILVDIRTADKALTFVKVPAGSKAKTIRLNTPFNISRYPVTNSQYRVFVDDGGYTNACWWSERGWIWQSEAGKEAPGSWHEERWAGPNMPVGGVTYWEAEAFATWAGGTLPSHHEIKEAVGRGGLLWPRSDRDRGWPMVGMRPGSARHYSFIAIVLLTRAGFAVRGTLTQYGKFAVVEGAGADLYKSLTNRGAIGFYITR